MEIPFASPFLLKNATMTNCFSRRIFVKRAAISTAALSTTALLAPGCTGANPGEQESKPIGLNPKPLKLGVMTLTLLQIKLS